MAKIPELSKPGTIRPFWMTAVATGQSTNAQMPLSHLGQLPRGAIALSMADYVADTVSTTDANPGAGKLRWNNSTQASSTQVFIADDDDDGISHASLWATLQVGGRLYLHDPLNLDCWQQWLITSVVDASGYAKLAVTLEASSESFDEAAGVVVTIQQPNPAVVVPPEPVVALSIASGVVNIDCSLGKNFTLLLNANVTSITFSNLNGAGYATEFELELKQDASGGKTVALPAALKPLGGSDTTVASAGNAVTVLSAKTFDNGTTWRYAMQESS